MGMLKNKSGNFLELCKFPEKLEILPMAKMQCVLRVQV
jgi:hypothetical protein